MPAAHPEMRHGYRGTSGTPTDRKATAEQSCRLQPRTGSCCECGNRSDGCDKAIYELQKLEFAINDVALYLDAYPDSCAALAYYQKLIAERDALRMAYQTACGPMTIYENTSAEGWKWTNGPWPWHYEGN